MLLNVDTESNRPLVRQICDQLRSQIRRHRLVPDQRLPSMRQLSRECGVSLGIVKQAINTLTTEGFLRTQHGSGVFVADPKLARKTIALVLPSLDVEQMLKIIRGVKQGLMGGAGQLLVLAADYDFDQEVDLLTNLDRSFVGGAIIYPPPLNSYAAPLQELGKRGLPYVLVDTAFEMLAVDSVTTEHLEMGRLAFGHLLERGHQRIGVVDQTADALTLQQMRQGADEVLREYGLRFTELPRVAVSATDLDSEYPWANGEKATRRLLADHPRLTAIVGMNDNLSLGVLRGAKSLNLHVPRNVSVMGIGDLTAFQTTDPPLTVVDQPHQEMGRVAVEILLEILRGNAAGSPKAIRLRPRLIERSSVLEAASSPLEQISPQTSIAKP